MEDKNNKLDKVLEGYRPIPMGNMRYPRLSLSEDFINSFHREYDRLVEEGQSTKSLLERLSKALRFHVTEDRRYKALEEDEDLTQSTSIEEEGCNKGTHKDISAKEINDIPIDPHEGDRGEEHARRNSLPVKRKSRK